MATTIVRNFTYRNQSYTIVKDGKFYMTINQQFIDADGRITKELHYNDGLHTNETLEGCIRDTKNDLDMKYYMANGKSQAEAFAIVFDMMDRLEDLKELFSK